MNAFSKLTVGKINSGEGEPETSADLVVRRSTKVGVDSVFEQPHNKTNDYEEATSGDP